MPVGSFFFLCDIFPLSSLWRAFGRFFFSLEVPKDGLDGALGSLIWWGATSPRQGLGLGGFNVPFNPTIP